MHHTPLSHVRHRVSPGCPLPFNIYRHDTTLLLARGQLVHTDEQMTALLDRGSLVDLRELTPETPNVGMLPRSELPGAWSSVMDEIALVLQRPDLPTFTAALDTAADPLQQLIIREPDLAIFQVLQHEGHEYTRYGVRHSIHAAIVAQLVSQRLGWPTEDRVRATKAALTMNLSILTLQGALAARDGRATDAERQQLRAHPEHSRDLLVQAGITDAEWLRAVLQHHEDRDGSGYPAGLTEPSELATLLRRADVYTAKLSPRGSREAQAADEAGRAVFMQDPGHPICAALVKEFGVYPPGCFVALASGETGVVVARGSTVMTPLVAALTNGYGAPLPAPIRRDTRQPLHAIVQVLKPRQMRAKLRPEQLIAVTG